MNPIAIRLLNQQLVSPLFSSPADVVSHMGAMQAQEYKLMRWAVAMRTKKPSAKAFKEAFDKGQIIRLHLHRGTWQLISNDDYWWMLQLCGPKALSTIKGWMTSNKISIDEHELMSIREILTDAASDRQSVTKEDFVAALARKDIQLDDHRLSYHIRMSELSGTLCSGDLHPSKATYCLTSKKVGKREAFDKDLTLLLLTRKYFQSHSPATLEDFMWWSGLNMSDCKRGIELASEEIHKEMFDRQEFYIHDSCRIRGFRKGTSLLLPSYDEYLIGYKSRYIALSPEYSHHAHNNSGIFYPIITHDGVVCGNWGPSKKEIETKYFNEYYSSIDLSSEWDRYQKYQTQ